ncbi:hypothetical protein [Thioalkalivibrio sp. ALE16]|uniref:hypothetical protein n=1 Tax=Thioalkalivibrio sp. ALE16 TaxID=1158172 RepID=UPI000369FC4F|nr:hypothetical protein [Thioalkalivibrio sp. ALE16]
MGFTRYLWQDEPFTDVQWSRIVSAFGFLYEEMPETTEPFGGLSLEVEDLKPRLHTLQGFSLELWMEAREASAHTVPLIPNAATESAITELEAGEGARFDPVTALRPEAEGCPAPLR